MSDSLRVHCESEHAELQTTIMTMDMETYESYLQDNGLTPTLDECYQMVVDHSPLDRPAVEDLPLELVDDLLRHITPDPPCGPHPDELV